MKEGTAQGCPSWWHPDQLRGHQHGPAEGKSGTSTGSGIIAHLPLAGSKDGESNVYRCPLAMLCPSLPTFKADVILISTVAHML